jgi:hypothetical protein
MLPGCGHWTQQDRANEVNAAIIEIPSKPVDEDSGGRHWRPAMFPISGSANNAKGFLPPGPGGASHLDRTEPCART